MIRVKLVRENENYVKVEIKGHAMYDDFGKDIVCAAVSSIATTTVNAALSLNEDSLKYMVNNGELSINEISSDTTTQKLIENMVSLLKQLETQYAKNIEIK